MDAPGNQSKHSSEQVHTEALKGIGNRIRQARLKRGLSLQIAHRIRDRADIKLDPSRLSRIERGQAELRVRTLMALSDYLDEDLGALMATCQPSDYVLGSPELTRRLARLGNLIGEEEAARRMSRWLGDICDMVEAAGHEELEAAGGTAS